MIRAFDYLDLNCSECENVEICKFAEAIEDIDMKLENLYGAKDVFKISIDIECKSFKE